MGLRHPYPVENHHISLTSICCSLPQNHPELPLKFLQCLGLLGKQHRVERGPLSCVIHLSWSAVRDSGVSVMCEFSFGESWLVFTDGACSWDRPSLLLPESCCFPPGIVQVGIVCALVHTRGSSFTGWLDALQELPHFQNASTKTTSFFFLNGNPVCAFACLLVLHCKGQVCANTTVSLYCASLYDTLQNKGWAYCVLPYGLAVEFTFGYLFFLLFFCLCATHFIAFLG